MRNVTTPVSRSVVKHIKAYSEMIIPEFRVSYGDLLVIVTTYERTLQDSLQEIKATYNTLSQTIRISVVVPYDITGSWLAEFVPRFKRSLRHEFEHYRQHQRSGNHLGGAMVPHTTVEGHIPGNPIQGPWTTVLMAARYLLNPLEIEAHVVGMKMEAQTRRVAFSKVLAETLQKIHGNFLELDFSASSSNYLIYQVYQTWGFYALKRFPSLRKKRLDSANKN